jgi:hypothetical protein
LRGARVSLAYTFQRPEPCLQCRFFNGGRYRGVRSSQRRVPYALCVAVNMTASDIIALGSLAITVLIHARAGPKPVIWLFSIVFLGALVVSVVSRVKPNNHRTPPPQSATASGGSTIIQAGGNVTIINPGVQGGNRKAAPA